MIILAAGGTGGHVFPALAVAEELSVQVQKVHLIVDQRTEHLIPAAFEKTVLNIAPPSAGKPKQLVGILKAAKQVLPLVKKAKSVGCFGGYPAFPVGMAAVVARTPLILHEQNAVIGRANRMLTRFAKTLALSYKNTQFAPKPNQKEFQKVVVTGNPVRQHIKPVPYPEIKDAIHILITGGSLGASIFSNVVPAAFELLSPEQRQKFQITQQCRSEDLDTVQNIYDQLDMTVTLAPFFENLPQKIAESHLIICRAGASTLAELTTIGRPAILVPYPHAAHDHQTKNAENTVGCMMVAQDYFTKEYLLNLMADYESFKSKILTLTNDFIQPEQQPATSISSILSK